MKSLSQSAAAALIGVSVGMQGVAAHAAGSPAVERNTQAFLQALADGGGTPLEQLSPAAARAVLVGAQASVKLELPAADISEKIIQVNGRSISLTIVRPAGVAGVLPAFMFFHGGGWVLGDFPTHERFVRDLVARSGAVAVFVNYTPSPEARFPVAIYEAYDATRWVAENGGEINVDGARLAIAGNSVGGNMTAAVAQLAKQKGTPSLRYQVLFWPVTDAAFDTPSYNEFAQDHFLTKPMMQWFWDNYTLDAAERANPLASPLRASADQLNGLPPALIQTAEKDVLRDEGEAYARKLDEAGVDVVVARYNGMIHDFGLLNVLSHLPATRAALDQAADALKAHLR